jgi:hypothetical protein
VNGKLKEYQIKVERAAFSSVMTKKVATLIVDITNSIEQSFF